MTKKLYPERERRFIAALLVAGKPPPYSGAYSFEFYQWAAKAKEQLFQGNRFICAKGIRVKRRRVEWYRFMDWLKENGHEQQP